MATLPPIRNYRALKIEVRPERYKLAVYASFAPVLPLIVLMVFGWGIHIGPFTIRYWVLFMFALLVYWGDSIYRIKTDEFAGIMSFETAVRERAQGLLYAPKWLTDVARFPRSLNKERFPGPTERISSVSDEETTRLGTDLYKPIRITTGGPEQGNEFMDSNLNSEQTFEPIIDIDWQAQLDENPDDDDQGFFELYVNIPGKTWEQKYLSVVARLRSTAEGVLNIRMSKHSAAWCIKYKDLLTAEVRSALEESVANWGIVICEVNVSNITPSKIVNIALGSVAEATAKSKAASILADGEAAGITKRGDAQNTVDKNKLIQRAIGESVAAKLTNMSVAERLGYEVVGSLGDKTTIVLGLDGIKDLAHGAAKKLLEK